MFQFDKKAHGENLRGLFSLPAHLDYKHPLQDGQNFEDPKGFGNL